MIVMRIKGGLGNQLFQYAAAYSISKRLNQEYVFNPSFTSNMTPRGYKLPRLAVDIDTVLIDNDLPYGVRVIKNAYVNKFFRTMNFNRFSCGEFIYWLETKDIWQTEFNTIEAKNLYIDGYFQSEEYFAPYRRELLQQFLPNYQPEIQYMEVFNKISSCNSVAVHVRRSDFKKDNNPFHYILSVDYYKRAIEYIRSKVDKATFFWFSDDINWVKENFGNRSDFFFVDIKTKNCDIDDMMLMKNCKNIITANSTFSWWAAWLNESESAIRVVPNRPFGMEGMIPDSWIKI